MRERDEAAGQTAPRLDRLTGAILDRRYRIDEKLAAGGFGAIYRATDIVMGRQVALKILHRELAGDAAIVARFRREAAALALLRDPHTITMYDVGQAPDGTGYIVMELLRGESLFEVFHAEGRLPWRRVVRIARGVCSSLREAHSLGIVHRDLKPANIFLETHALERDFVKVLDFGIAKMIETEPGIESEDITLAGQTIGTYDYMPPEQMVGGLCSGRSDVFTLAVVMYEMIAGARPYGDAKGPATMLMTLLGTTPVPLLEREHVPFALDRLIMRALQRDPEDRVDIGDFDDELARILEADTFDEDEARFGEEDGPTWLDPGRSESAPLHFPPRHAPARPTLVGMVPPARDVVPLPRSRAPLPLSPVDIAVGSKTDVQPLASLTPLPELRPPTRMPSGSTSPVNQVDDEPTFELTTAQGIWIRVVVYVLLALIVGTAVYFLQ